MTKLFAGLFLILCAMSQAQSFPVPLINQPLVPSSVAPGIAAFKLTVNGTGFVSGSVVNWNGSPRATSFVSGSQLTATILSADISLAETASITVTNPGVGTLSNVEFFPVTISSASAAFSRSDFSTSQGSEGVIAADFNRDGKLDLALTLVSSILILPGNGDGTFGAATAQLGSGETYPLAADLNGDGNPDLVVSSDGNELFVYLGNGNGTFGPAMLVNTPYQANGLITAGDFNGDGTLDLAVTFGGVGISELEIFLGKGDGTFTPGQIYSANWTFRPVSTADINGDGKLDLVVGGWDTNGNGTLLIYLGNGDGTFQPPSSIAVQPPSALLIADLNSDGKLDIAASTGGSTISVLLGNGDGTFQPVKYYSSGPNSVWFTGGDFNADGFFDLATANESGNTVSVLLANGDGAQTIGVGSLPNGIAAGDFNGDGRLDLAVCNFESTFFTVLLQTAVLSPQSLNFGNQPVGSSSQAQTISFTNVLNVPVTISSISTTGPNAGDFSQTNNCPGSLASGSVCNVSVTFTPAATGLRTATLSVVDSAPGTPHVAALSGTGTEPSVVLSPTALAFGNQTVGMLSNPLVTTLTNSGNGTLTITSVGITGTNGGDFAETNNCPASLSAGASCTISVTFTPSTTGSRTASLSVTDNAPGSPQTASLRGTGVLPLLTLSPTTLTFPTTVVFTSSPSQTVTLTNTGLGIMTINSIVATNPFLQTNTCGTTVAPGASCTITVRFKPSNKGQVTGSLAITDNAPGSPQRVKLSGVGTFIQTNPASIGFGNQPVGTTSFARQTIVTNQGHSTVSISSIAITGTNTSDFAETNTCGTSLASGASCKIVVTFTPSAKGKRTANVAITDNGGGSPQIVALSGTGT